MCVDNTIQLLTLLGLDNHDINRIWRYYPLKLTWSCLHNLNPICCLLCVCLLHQWNLVNHPRNESQKTQDTRQAQRDECLYEGQKCKRKFEKSSQCLLIPFLSHQKSKGKRTIEVNYWWANPLTPKVTLSRVLWLHLQRTFLL